MNLSKIIIWGHELHNHTHSYIHNAFYITFKHLNYDVYWFNEDGKNNYPKENEIIDFNNSLYIAHGLESKNLPLNETSHYICHNFNFINIDEYLIPENHSLRDQVKGIPHKNITYLQVYTNYCLNNENVERCEFSKHYYHLKDNSCIYMTWATDLLPCEIDDNIAKISSFKAKNISNFIGMPLEHNFALKKALQKDNIEYAVYGGTFNKNSNQNKSTEENMKLIQESIIAPALQSEWQKEHHYIPCRIFKNISYGKMGMTNSNAVYEFFEKKILYSENIDELVKIGLKFEKKEDKNDHIKELMIYVRDNHTYVNRIAFTLEFLRTKKDITVKKYELI